MVPLPPFLHLLRRHHRRRHPHRLRRHRRRRCTHSGRRRRQPTLQTPGRLKVFRLNKELALPFFSPSLVSALPPAISSSHSFPHRLAFMTRAW